MKNGVALVYLGIVLIVLILFVIFDKNVNYQEAKADDLTRISRINMLNAETGENIRLCELAKSAGQGTIISIKAAKIFKKYAEKNLKMGSGAASLWNVFLDSGIITGAANQEMDKIKLGKNGAEKDAEIFAGLKVFIDKSAENGYNFEF